MLITNSGDTIDINGKIFEVGGRVLSNKNSDYGGLYGAILEIRTGSDKETDNEGIDIYTCFDTPKSDDAIKLLEERFSHLYGEAKTIDDIALDLVIMTPDELEIV